MKIFIFCLSLCFSRSLTIKYNVWNPEKYRLPNHILYGVSSSAYQVEGAWNQDGKGESIWDRYLHTHPEEFAPGPNGDDACDSYNKLDRDIEMLRELGVDYYRFSISWSRVLPTGFANKINPKGLQYYLNLTKELNKYYIEAIVTMYHYDLPQPLQELGGWTNPNIVNWFEEYARVLYTHLKTVKYWITINEPSVCFKMYGGAKVAPAVESRGVDDYKCVKNMLLAHARAYRLYRTEFNDVRNDVQMVLVGISLNLNWVDAPNFHMTKELNMTARVVREFTCCGPGVECILLDKTADIQTTPRIVFIDMYLHPIFSDTGDFPPLVKQIVAQNSAMEGLAESRLPKLSPDEIALLNKSADFIGINHYTTYYVNKPKPGEKRKVYPHLPVDVNVELTQSDLWPQSKTPGIKIVPYGLYRTCMYLNQLCDRPLVIITEYGWSTDPGRNDTERVRVMFQFLKAMVYALHEDADIRGLTIWSLMDSIEWTAGTTQRYGLYEVDFESPKKTRSPRLSAHYFRNLAETGLVIENYTIHSNLSLDISPRKAKARKQKIT